MMKQILKMNPIHFAGCNLKIGDLWTGMLKFGADIFQLGVTFRSDDATLLN